MLLVLIFYFVFNQKIIFPSSQSKEVKITLNIQDFEPSQPAELQSSIESDQQALAEATKKLFEKIADAEPTEPEPPTKEVTKEIFEKIAKASKAVSLQSTTEEAIEKAKLAKMEQKRLEVQKKEQEALAKAKAQADEKARLEKLEQTRINALAIATAKEKAKLALIEQERLKKEKKKQEALTKALKKKQEKLKKQKLAKAHKKKLHKQKLAQKRQASKKQKRSKKHSKDPLANAIMSASTSVRPRKSKRPAMRMIKQFYGSEFNAFTPTQKKFIEKNLGSIYRITQRTLTRNGYPRVAARTQQQGTQIVTFYLHPNGAISGLRLKKRVGYASLDKNTIKVIRIAYKDYPRPKTKTKITFYVEYSLF